MARPLKTSLVISILMSLLFGGSAAEAQVKGLLVRLAEIEIDSGHLEEYAALLKEEAEASVRLEPGVISIFPMFQKDNPTEIRILEIYASQEAYEAHLQTPHFKKYKTTTLEMVKSLKLIDMEPLDTQTMDEVFKKARVSLQ
jgi:quinol monooxygenase YgiN